MRKRKIGITLILIGVGIPLVLFFFQTDGYIVLKKPKTELISRPLTQSEIEIVERNRKALLEREEANGSVNLGRVLTELTPGTGINIQNKTEEWWIRTESKYSIPYKYFVGIGSAIILFGIGMMIFSLFPNKEKYKEKDS